MSGEDILTASFDHILALDASTETLHLAVSFGEDRLVQSSDHLGRRHGQMLFRKIEQLLESAALSRDEISGLVLCTGPGSFTGLRVSIAAMKGFAMARQIPVVGISLFDLLAWSQYEDPQSQLAVIRLNREELATVIFANRLVVPDTIRIGPAADVLGAAPDYPTWLINVADISPDSPLPAGVRHFTYDAGLLLACGRERLDAGERSDLHGLEPLYLQASTAERNWAARNQHA